MRSAAGVRAAGALYRAVISPILHAIAGPGMGCRLEPSCGRYAEEALERHGLLRGMRLIIGRLFRCQPWGRAGYDPVPEGRL